MIGFELAVPTKLLRQYDRQRKLEDRLELCKMKTKQMENRYLPKRILPPKPRSVGTSGEAN